MVKRIKTSSYTANNNLNMADTLHTNRSYVHCAPSKKYIDVGILQIAARVPFEYSARKNKMADKKTPGIIKKPTRDCIRPGWDNALHMRYWRHSTTAIQHGKIRLQRLL